MTSPLTERRDVQRPCKWTDDEWKAVQKAAKATGISPTNLPRVVTLAAIGFSKVGEMVKGAQRTVKHAKKKTKAGLKK